MSGGKSLTLGQDTFSALSISDLCIKDSALLAIDKNTFSKMESLSTLEVKNILSISVDNSLLHLPNLRSLHISNTKLKFDQFFSDGESSMDDLRFENCDLDVLREDLINHLKSLTTLSLAFNRLSSLPSESMRNLHYLQELNIENNRFGNIPHSSINGQLRALNLASNDLSRLDADSFGQKNLLITTLNMSRNSLKVIGERVFYAVQEVEVLDLSHNVIQAVVIDAFSKLLKLAQIFLGYNKLLFIPNALFNSNLKHLVFIDVAHNPITRIREDLSVSSEVTSLSHLMISKTNLSILTSQDFIGFPKVMQLTLSNNKVSRISPGAFGSLRILQMLDLSHNLLEIVPSERLSGLFNLRSLNLSRNDLTRLNKFGKNHKQLDQLDISYNKLTKIFSWNFNPLVQLNVLLAHHNQITWIDKDAFENLTSLQDLDISHNKLAHIDGGFLDPIESSLEMLIIKG
ncbi:Insulin-like growth factor-binding protein complex acid labile subunit [Nymphon striatum]|nr:Insulin-like growth factor-binding protein complex acid labile subunit [Nymphon striatum]